MARWQCWKCEEEVSALSISWNFSASVSGIFAKKIPISETLENISIFIIVITIILQLFTRIKFGKSIQWSSPYLHVLVVANTTIKIIRSVFDSLFPSKWLMQTLEEAEKESEYTWSLHIIWSYLFTSLLAIFNCYQNPSTISPTWQISCWIRLVNFLRAKLFVICDSPKRSALIKSQDFEGQKLAELLATALLAIVGVIISFPI